MEEQTSNSKSIAGSPFIPLVLLGFALVLILVWQLFVAWSTRSALRAQFEERKDLVKQSELVQGNVQNLVNDLLILAESDADARQIVQKYKIRRTQPTGN
ncbi:MAG: hypothetical protein AAF558_02080 [Verrucomicrobiota bacterium]